MASTADGTAADEPEEQASDSSRAPFDPPVDSPLGSPLDSMANLRLLGEVQRRGLEAANLVIARLTERTNATSAGPAGTAGPDQAAVPNGSDPVTAMTETFVSSMAAMMAALSPESWSPGAVPGTGSSARPGSSSGTGSSSGDTAAAASPEVLHASGAAGETVEVDVWLHNYTDELAAGIELRSTGLLSAGGAVLSADRVHTRPEHPVDLSAESSRMVQLCVDLPADTPPGRYRGVVAASHLADLWLVLDLDVRAAHAS
jgi:hypothetical protein